MQLLQVLFGTRVKTTKQNKNKTKQTKTKEKHRWHAFIGFLPESTFLCLPELNGKRFLSFMRYSGVGLIGLGMWIQKSQIQFITLLVYWNSTAKDRDTIFLYENKKKKVIIWVKITFMLFIYLIYYFFFSNIEYSKLFNLIIYILSKCVNCNQLTWIFFFFFLKKLTSQNANYLHFPPLFLRESFNLWRLLPMIVFYHQIKTYQSVSGICKDWTPDLLFLPWMT